MIKALTLDLDDTLWPVAATIRGAERALLAHLEQVAPNTAAHFQSDNIKRWRQQVVEQHPTQKNDLSFLRRELIRLALTEHADNPSLAEPAFAVFFEARQQVVLFDDAIPALEKLAAKLPIIALSNGNADIKKIGIDRYFVGRVSSATLPQVKPHPAVFEYAARLAKASLANTLHVGDDVALDVVGALRVGMNTAWIHREGQSWEEAEQHQARLHASYGMTIHNHQATLTHERPDIQAVDLLQMIEQLEDRKWI